jgi:hypothetical protein
MRWNDERSSRSSREQLPEQQERARLWADRGRAPGRHAVRDWLYSLSSRASSSLWCWPAVPGWPTRLLMMGWNHRKHSCEGSICHQSAGIDTVGAETGSCLGFLFPTPAFGLLFLSVIGEPMGLLSVLHLSCHPSYAQTVTLRCLTWQRWVHHAVNYPHLSSICFSFFFFWWDWGLSSGLCTLAKQALYCLSHSFGPFSCFSVGLLIFIYYRK